MYPLIFNISFGFWAGKKWVSRETKLVKQCLINFIDLLICSIKVALLNSVKFLISFSLYRQINQQKPIQVMVVYTTDNNFCNFWGSAMLHSLLAEDISKKVQDTDLWVVKPLVSTAPTTKVVLPILQEHLPTLSLRVSNETFKIISGTYVKSWR